jgi:hypothetical protein
VISLTSVKEFVLETTMFADLDEVGVFTGPTTTKGFEQLWMNKVTFQSITFSDNPLVVSAFPYTYCDGLTAKRVSLQQGLFKLPPKTADDASPVFRGLSCDSVGTMNALFSWDGQNPPTYIVFEGANFTNTRSMYQDYVLLYFEGCRFSVGAGDVSKVGPEASGKISVVACTFEGLDSGVKSSGGSGDANRMLVCRSQFTSCGKCIDAIAKSHWEIANCLFRKFSECGINIACNGVSDIVLTRCAFYEPVSNNGKAPVGITGSCQTLNLQSVCFGYQGVAIRYGGVGKVTSCCFAGSYTQSFDNVNINDQNFKEATAGFSCKTTCDATTYQINDPTACDGLKFPKRPTPRRTDTHVVAPPSPAASEKPSTRTSIISASKTPTPRASKTP